MRAGAQTRIPGQSCVAVDPLHVEKRGALWAAREPGDLGSASSEPYDRPAGEGDSRTAHVHASEESDSGAAPIDKTLVYCSSPNRPWSRNLQLKSGTREIDVLR